jgi:hypothetical protein
MNIKDMVLTVLGLEPRRPEPIIQGQTHTDPADRLELAARTEGALRQPTPPAQPGRPLRGIATDDLEDYRLRADYLERRAAREAERQPKAQELYVIERDISPR